MELDKNQEAFFALLRAGLWEQEVRLEPYGEIDFPAILDLAEEQSVVGLLAAGIEHVVDRKPQKKAVLQFIGRTVQLEQRNQAMNYFIGVMVEKMRAAGIEAVLVKGQGVAQCYERPLWRSCGDVDLFLSDENYERAKAFLTPLAASVEEEYVREKHLGMTIDPWVVELHGRLYGGLSGRIERELDGVYRETFGRGVVRSWDNSGVRVPQLAVENDVFYVFTHILQHFYKGGIGLRQVIDYFYLLRKCKADGMTGQAKAEFRKTLKDFGMTKFASAIMYIMHHVLGIDKECLLLEPNEKEGKFLLNEVLLLGNFGRAETRKEALETAEGHFKRFLIYEKYNFRLLSHYPSEVIWRPIRDLKASWKNHKKEADEQKAEGKE